MRQGYMSNNLSKLVGQWGAVFGLFLSGVFLAGCQTGSDPRFSDLQGSGSAPASPAAAPATTQVAAAAPAPPTLEKETDVYRFKPGEALTITFSDLPQGIVEPEKKDRIKEDGTITLLYNKTFVAAGKTRAELEQEIRKGYVPDIFRNLTVTINYEPQTRFYFVGGEVKKPDRQVYMGRMTVIRAIQSAGDFTEFAKKTKVQLIRADGRKYIVNYSKALKDPKLDLEVFPGDTITVPRRIW